MATGIEGRMAAELDRRRVWGYTDDENFNREIAQPWKRSAFDPYEFIGKPYPRGEVEGDLKKIDDIKKSPDFRHERGSETVALEYVLMDGIKVHGWFGDEVESVRKTSEYDDVKNGVDFVVTFYDEESGQFVNLAIDATTAVDRFVLDRKKERIFRKLGFGEMAKVKYFEDPDGNRGKVEMPCVVLALGPEKTFELQKMLVAGSREEKFAPEMFDFLDSASEQLFGFINYTLHRRGFLARERELKNLGEIAGFMDRHRGDIDEPTEKIIDSHFAALKIIGMAAARKRIERQITRESIH
ncbi:hypothetical protein HZB93_01715 [Candidatus Falkowbacteria bacterium]|nr:hypothetical protein [Candidatus Falkowbacteria bacterium]